MRHRSFIALLLLGLASAISTPVVAQSRNSRGDTALARSIMTELIAIRSVSGSRETVTAANAINRGYPR